MRAHEGDMIMDEIDRIALHTFIRTWGNNDPPFETEKYQSELVSLTHYFLDPPTLEVGPIDSLLFVRSSVRSLVTSFPRILILGFL